MLVSKARIVVARAPRARIKSIALLTLGMIVFMAGSSAAFDGVRKGFVVGGGLGIAANAHWEFDNSSLGEDKAGLAVNLLIGYAWDESNMLVYEGNVAAYSTDRFFSSNKQNATQGFNGAAWYHYYGAKGESLFTSVGVGVYVFDIEELDSNDPGFGLLLGLGYELSRHWQFGLYLSAGRTTFGSIDVNHSNISVILDAIAF